MTTHLVWFSWKLDAAPLLQAVRCAKATFPEGTKFHVFDQGTNPLDQATVTALQEAGVRYVVTWFERNGNLNGTTSVVGEIQCFMSCGADLDDVIWKTDCDTLILQPEVMLKRYAADPNLLGCGIEMPSTRIGWWGPSYSYRAGVLPAMLNHFIDHGCRCCMYPEDVAMSLWLMGNSRNRTITLLTNQTGGDYAWYNWKTAHTLKAYSKMFSIITFGARFQMKSFSPVQQRLRQAAYMQTLLDSYLP